jgi:lipopolysaccharide transport system ATP-binding protein
MSVVISIQNVCKSYRLGMIGGATLKEDLARWWAKARGKPDPLAMIGEENHGRSVGERFLALQNVSFDVRDGEIIGIIGHNGAGKSTLLKILSQVTAPTSGEIKIKGRIASLLEVGTGFHPELTGRENIFLNGAILGMTKSEIRSKFDEIVAFSGIEEFIGTPVKRYSSGMYVRLAFAVAAHLEPEILIVDEVLAVGDAEFQKKCLGKMQAVSNSGRTVLFVSHNMGAVNSLCDRVALLEGGRVRAIGPTERVIAEYYGSRTAARDRSTAAFRRAGYGREVHVTEVRLGADEAGLEGSHVEFGEDLTLTFVVVGVLALRSLSIGCSIFSALDVCVGSLVTNETFSIRPGERKKVQLTIKAPNLAPGQYYFGFSVGQGGNDGGQRIDHDIIVGLPVFEVLPVSKSEESFLANWSTAWGFFVLKGSELVVEEIEEEATPSLVLK